MKLPNDFFDHEDFESLSEQDKVAVEKRIIEDAFENSYRVITHKVTFEDLLDEMATGRLASALMAHSPEDKPKKEVLENMILHFSSDEYEEYEKCAELQNEMNRLYPETIGKIIV